MPRAEQFVVQRTRLVGVDDELTIGSQIVGIDDGVTFLRDVNGTNALATAFQELRVANPLAWLDQVNKYEIDTDVWGQLTASGGTITHIPEQSAIRLAVTSASGSRALLRTNRYFRYQAGRSMRIRWTGYHADAGVANQDRMWGFFDDNDGLFFRIRGTTVSVVRRSSTSGVVVSDAFDQSTWNRDKMDGSGPDGGNPSGVTLDLTKGSIFEIDFQWLGVGTAKFSINGHVVHTLEHANTIAGPYMRTAQLPVSMEIVNTGASTASSLTHICASLQIEGGDTPPEDVFCAFNSTDVTVTTTERPVLSIRPKLTYGGQTNRMIVVPRLLVASTEGGRAGFRLIYGTLTGASWASVNTRSGTERDSSATAITGGQTLLRSFLPNSNEAQVIELDDNLIFGRLRKHLHLDAFGVSQPILTVAMVNEGAGNTLCRGSLTFGEIR